jgi:hypothetical protein
MPILKAGPQPYQYTPEQIIGMMVPPALCMDSNKLEYRVRSRAELETIAAGVGCNLWVRKPGELLLDLDSAESMLAFYERFRDSMITSVTGSVGLPRMWVSRSGYGMHAALGLRQEVGDCHAAGLEVALGSDWRRGILNMKEVLEGNEVSSCLFKPKEAAYVPFSDLPRYVERLLQHPRPAAVAVPPNTSPIKEEL